MGNILLANVFGDISDEILIFGVVLVIFSFLQLLVSILSLIELARIWWNAVQIKEKMEEE